MIASSISRRSETPARQALLSAIVLLLSFSQTTVSNATEPDFGVASDPKMGLPSRIGLFDSATATLSGCLMPTTEGEEILFKGSAMFSVRFSLSHPERSELTLDSFEPLNDVAPSDCTARYETTSGRYSDIMGFDGGSYYLTLDQTPEGFFRVVEAETIPETADIAFVLRGYNGTTLFPSVYDYRAEAKGAMSELETLSFGQVGSYRLFDGGIDQNGAGYYASVEDIKVIDAALSGWQGPYWGIFLERDGKSGSILVDPSEEEVAVLQTLREWLVENRLSAREWRTTPLGSIHYTEWVQPKVLRYGGTAARNFLKEIVLPDTLKPENFSAIGITFSSDDSYNTSGLMSSCEYFEIRNSDGDTVVEEPLASMSCFYSDSSNLNPDLISPSDNRASNQYVVVHEAIHAFGQGGHDRFEGGDYFPYSVMNQGVVDQYPVWNRIYLLGWLTESVITDDPNELTDTFGATDPTLKYLLKLSPENDFDCQNEFGEARKCHRYQEIYNGGWVQYRTDYTVDGNSYFKGGVTFERLRDVSDSVAAEPLSGAASVTLSVQPDRHSIEIHFNETVSFGEGRLILKDADSGHELGFYDFDRIAGLSSERIQFKGDSLELTTYAQDIDDPSETRLDNALNYLIEGELGAIIDRAGNAVAAFSLPFSGVGSASN